MNIQTKKILSNYSSDTIFDARKLITVNCQKICIRSECNYIGNIYNSTTERNHMVSAFKSSSVGVMKGNDR